MDEMKWRKASRTTANGENCVEVARIPDEIAMRDSKNPDGPQQRFSILEVAAFFTEIKCGKYDLS
ncbi:DUF397 domain-containing protein [Actinomadura formosensis]|uniref:DUF397 domain-containing protein n=1 Tax=Actinomadura formosensis TaxID=60706 RepID=UPI003D92A392